MTRYLELNHLLSGVTLYPYGQRPKCCEGDFFANTDPQGFCGFFSMGEIARTLGETGCLTHWKSQGYEDVQLSVSREGEGCHHLGVFTRVGGQLEWLLHLEVWLEYVEIARPGVAYPAFCVDRLLLQRPGVKPEYDMPGQAWASSGLLRRFFGVIGHWAARTGARIVTEIPEFFHTAYIFSRHFSYIDWEMEGIFRKVCRDLLVDKTPAGVSALSRDFENKHVTRNGGLYEWPTEMQVMALEHGLAEKLRVPGEVLDDGEYLVHGFSGAEMGTF